MSGFTLGYELQTGKAYNFELEVLKLTHSLILGATGDGKTRLLLFLVRLIIRLGYALGVIDGKGDLCRAIQRDLAWNMIGPDRVAIIDPGATKEYAPGFNPIALNGREPYTRAKTVLEAFKRLQGEEEEFKPWLEEITLNSLVPLSHAGLGLLELEEFLQNDRLRETLVLDTPDPRLHRYWAHKEGLPAKEKHALLMAALTRAGLLWSGGEGIRRILGQLRDTLDWEKVLSPGGVLLVNANASSGVDSSAARFLGTLCLQKIIEAASLRPENERNPLFLIIDELHNFASSDVVEALEKLRGFGVHLLISGQFLGQFEEVPGLRGAVDSCCQNRFIFSTSAVDAEELQAQVYAGHRPDRGTLQQIHTVYFEPKTKWMEVESVSHHPEVTTENEGSETTRYHPETTTHSYGPDGFFSTGSEVGHTTSEAYEETIESGSSFATTPEHDVITRAKQHITEHDKRSQLTSQQIETLEDLKEHGRVALMRQPRQHCTIQLQHSAPVPLKVVDVPEAKTSDELLECWQRLIYRGYPRADVLDQELEQRAQRFLENKPVPYNDFKAIETTPLSVPKKKRD